MRKYDFEFECTTDLMLLNWWFLLHTVRWTIRFLCQNGIIGFVLQYSHGQMAVGFDWYPNKESWRIGTLVFNVQFRYIFFSLHLMTTETQESYIIDSSNDYPDFSPPNIGNETHNIFLGFNLKGLTFLELRILVEIHAGNFDLKSMFLLKWKG